MKWHDEVARKFDSQKHKTELTSLQRLAAVITKFVEKK